MINTVMLGDDIILESADKKSAGDPIASFLARGSQYMYE
jgi:hypothetical protein